MTDTKDFCRRCMRAVDKGELCLFCEETICSDCWENHGVCGCPGSDEFQARFMAAGTDEERRALMDSLPPIGQPAKRES